MTSIRKRIWLWALYDFANSLGFVSVVFYFGPWFIVSKGGSDLWMSVAVGLATILMIFTLPFLGNRSDTSGKRMPYLSMMTVLCVLSLIVLGFVTNHVATLTTPLTLLIIALYLLFHYFYQSGAAFYNALMFPLTTQGSSPEKVSGLGMGIGQLGSVLGLALLVPVAKAGIPLVGVTGPSAAFIAGAVAFLTFALPMFLFFRETPTPRRTESGGRWKTLRATMEDLRKIRQYPGVLTYLIAYYLFADALLTITLFVTTYLDAVAGMSDSMKSVSLIIGAALGIVGGLISPYVARLFDTRKRALGFSIASWAVLVAAIALVRTPIIFAVTIALNGFAYGLLFALSRAYYSTLIPADKQATFFSVYALFERTASVLGPLLWSGIAVVFVSFGPDRYRFSMFAMAIMIALSFLVLRFVPEKKTSEVV